MNIKESVKNTISNNIKINLNKRIDRIINKDLKQYTSGPNKFNENDSIQTIVNSMYSWYFIQFDKFCNERGITDRLSLVDLDTKQLLDIYNLSELYNILNEKVTKRQFYYFDNDYLYNRKIKYAVLYNIIEQGGAIDGPINGLIFAKMYELNKASIMKYGLNYRNVNLDDLIVKYLELGGNVDVDCYPYYFDKTNKKRYDIIPLKDIVRKTNYHVKKRNS